MTEFAVYDTIRIPGKAFTTVSQNVLVGNLFLPAIMPFSSDVMVYVDSLYLGLVPGDLDIDMTPRLFVGGRDVGVRPSNRFPSEVPGTLGMPSDAEYWRWQMLDGEVPITPRQAFHVDVAGKPVDGRVRVILGGQVRL